MATGVVYDDIYLSHDTGSHPENKYRLIKTVEHLKKTGLWSKLEQIPVRKATVEEAAYIHAPAYIKEAE
ncbi:MAG: histone deacetylase, partial [Planctomycetota bacterium]